MVDLGADRATRDYAEERTARASIRLHWLPIGRRLAPAEANRRALDVLSTPLAALLDNDVVVPRGWLGPIVAQLTVPRVALVAPIRPDPFLQYPGRSESTEAFLDALKSSGRSLPEVVEAFTGGISLDRFGAAVAEANHLAGAVSLEFPSSLSSCCLGFDRAAVDESGGVADPIFDGRYGSEDIDLSWRVLEAGYEIVRTADVFVLHLRHASLEANEVDYRAELRAANEVLYGRWQRRLRSWARARILAGDRPADLSQRFIIRELQRNTAFGRDLEALDQSLRRDVDLPDEEVRALDGPRGGRRRQRRGR